MNFKEIYLFKGQLISKQNCQAITTSKKRPKPTRFLGEVKAQQFLFRDLLTFNVGNFFW